MINNDYDNNTWLDCDPWYMYPGKDGENRPCWAARFLYWELIDYPWNFREDIGSQVDLNYIAGYRLYSQGRDARKLSHVSWCHAVTTRKIQVQEMFSQAVGNWVLRSPLSWTIIYCYVYYFGFFACFEFALLVFKVCFYVHIRWHIRLV